GPEGLPLAPTVVSKGLMESLTLEIAHHAVQKLVSFPAKAGNPVRRAANDLAGKPLEYWVARSSRATTANAWLTPPTSRPAAHSRARGTWRRGSRNCGTGRMTRTPATAARRDRAVPTPPHRVPHWQRRHPASRKSRAARRGRGS